MYYMFFNIFILTLTVVILRLFFINTLLRINSLVIINKYFVSIILSVFLITMISLNTLLGFYQNLVYLGNLSSTDIMYIGTHIQNSIIMHNSLNLNLIQVYYYPFIYVFLLITILSIIFCLSYNQDELFAFMFFCVIILLAGYTLFFTDSLIIFFFSYEMLLVPSFFILYKFAKTRRCVEAAYLMFF